MTTSRFGASLILWCDGAHDAVENMRRDQALLEARERTPAVVRPAVLRLFRFAPPGITLGRAQQPERDLDLERCRADGVGWAVRPTGGRAIFHAEEWTFSLTARLDDPEWGGTLDAAYDRLSRLVHASLRRLGVPAERVRQSRGRADRSGVAPSAACFAATARHEIVLAGRKLVGIAQRRTRTALLQQGSLLLGEGHLRLADYLALPAEQRAAARASLARASTDSGSYLGSTAPLGRWADALCAEIEARRFDAAQGAFLLTAEKSRSYTPPDPSTVGVTSARGGHDA